MQENVHSSPNNDLHNNLLTSSDYQEVNNIEVNLEEDEYKEYKYRF